MADTAETAAAATTEVTAQAASGFREEFLAPIIETLRETLMGIVAAGPKIIIGAILFLFGFLLFKLIRKILVKFFKGIGADTIAEKIGLKEMLGRFGMRSGFSEFLGNLVFYLLMFHFLVQLSLALELTMLSDPLARVISFLPQVITATIVFVAGYLATDVVRRAVLRGAEGMGLDYAKTLSSLVYGFLLVMVTTLAVKELEIDTGLIETTVSIILGAMGLAIAIALGFGLQGLARNVVSGAYAREAYRTGSTITREGDDYRVVAVGAVSTRLEKEDGSFIMIPNSDMLTEEVHGRNGPGRYPS